MANSRASIVDILLAGQSGEIYVPEDGDLASMRGILKHRQVLTLAPVTNFRQVQANDIVLVKWRGGNTILHVVQEVQGDQFLIANSLGKINGWVNGSDILGRVVKIVEPEPLPGIPEMLEQLQAAFQKLVERTQVDEQATRRLFSVLDDLQWYAGRIGEQRWTEYPRQNKYSFRWHLWHITVQAQEMTGSPAPASILALIDHGKWHTGCVAELLALFEQEDWLDA
jgi:hypothetical protein